jgi:DNA end-binding protein Ku
MKAIWTGTISFGLVEIPIKLTSAIQSTAFGFRVLHEKCHTPLEYERWCPHCKKEVTWENTVKGFELADGSYRVFTKEELEALKPEKTDRIDIISFVAHDLIPDIYQENHYYALPNKVENKSYFLFQQALGHSKLVAIGRFVMREKEYLCSIEPYEKGLLLNTLNYSYEIRPLSDALELKKTPKVSKDEVNLASKLIAQMTKKKFDITKYKDEFVEQLKKELKTKKKKTTKKIERHTPKSKKNNDLLSTLRESLRGPQRSQPVAYASASRTKKRKKRA